MFFVQIAQGAYAHLLQQGGVALLFVLLLQPHMGSMMALRRAMLRCQLAYKSRLKLREFPSVCTSLLRRATTKERDRKSTRLNSSHVRISYAVFCLKKKKK